MKKILGILVVFALGFLMSIRNGQVFATEDCLTAGASSISITPAEFIEGDVIAVNVSFDAYNFSDGNYRVAVFDDRQHIVPEEKSPYQPKTSSASNLSFQFVSAEALTGNDAGINSTDTHYVYVFVETQVSKFCYLGSYDVKRRGYTCTEPIIISQMRDGKQCYSNGAESCMDTTGPINFEVSGAMKQQDFTTETILVRYYNAGSSLENPNPPGHISWSKNLSVGNYVVSLSSYLHQTKKYVGYNCEGADIKVIADCPVEECEEYIEPEPISEGPDVFSLCDQIPEDQEKQRADCLECTEGTNNEEEEDKGVWTAIGCIKRDPQIIIKKLITVGLQIGGGFTLITFLVAGFIFSTSQGSPERVKNAKEMMTASIMGLIFVIFSVSLLQFIGWSVLKIPGFGS